MFTWTSKGSVKGNRDVGIDITADMHLDADMAVSMNWGSFKKGSGLLLKGFGVDIKQVQMCRYGG